MRKMFLALAAVACPGLAYAHDSVIPHAHPHGIDAVFALIGVAAIGGILWYLGLPPFEGKATREIVRHNDRQPPR